jgi:hypothetical protein
MLKRSRVILSWLPWLIRYPRLIPWVYEHVIKETWWPWVKKTPSFWTICIEGGRAENWLTAKVLIALVLLSAFARSLWWLVGGTT